MRVNNNESAASISDRSLSKLFGPARRDNYEDCKCGVALHKEECELEKKNEKHFKLTDETIEYRGHTLYRIQCTETFVVNNKRLKDEYSEEDLTIKEGEFGGFVESENNLEGNAWVQENAKVFGDAKVSGNVVITGNVVICDRATVYGDAIVYGNALIEDDAEVSGKVVIGDNAKIMNHAEIWGKTKVYDKASVRDHARVYGKSCIEESAVIDDHAYIEDANIGGDVKIGGDAQISKITISGVKAKIFNDANISHEYDYMCFTNVGSRKDTLTAYRTKHNGVRITVGCFYGDLDEFRKDVAKKDESEAPIKKEYELIADVIQHRFIDHNTADYIKCNDNITEVANARR